MVWAPNSAHVDLLLSGAERGVVPMNRDELGYHVATLDNDAPAIFEGSLKFVQDHAGEPSG